MNPYVLRLWDGHMSVALTLLSPAYINQFTEFYWQKDKPDAIYLRLIHQVIMYTRCFCASDAY